MDSYTERVEEFMEPYLKLETMRAYILKGPNKSPEEACSGFFVLKKLHDKESQASAEGEPSESQDPHASGDDEAQAGPQKGLIEEIA